MEDVLGKHFTGEETFTLGKFTAMNIKITSSESKDNLERSGKWLITPLCLKAKAKPKKYKKARYAIVNVIMKDLSKIIKEFEKLSYESYERKRPKHEPTDTYFYLATHLAKFIMISDSLSSHVYPQRTKITATKPIMTSYVCSTDESKLKDFLVENNYRRFVPWMEMNQKASFSKKMSIKED